MKGNSDNGAANSDNENENNTSTISQGMLRTIAIASGISIGYI